MKLQSIIKGLSICDRRGRFEAEVGGICADSREVRPGDLFVAVKGRNHDGHDHVREAAQRGAVAVLAERWSEDMDVRGQRPDVALVPSSRRALGLAAANFYGQPSRDLHVAGVTGTNGKTTVTYVLEAIMRAAQRKVGVIGTVEARYDGERIDLGHTTPGPVELQATLAKMRDAGVSHVVMEVSSHALDQERVAGVHFKVAAFTNLSQDHLDYHDGLEAYFEAKARLFTEHLRRSRARGRMAVVQVDDPKGPELLERWGGKALAVSLDPASEADVRVLGAEYRIDGTTARIHTAKGEWTIQTALVGPHNLANVAVAVGLALSMGFSKARILRGLAALERVPGRFEPIACPKGRRCFVDYAHTPDALAKVLDAARPHAAGRLIVVFGAGGDRDKDKRPAMGEVVGQRADRVFVTTDNPRSEAPDAIAAGLVEGLERAGMHRDEGPMEGRSFTVELDRQTAIRSAVLELGPEDLLVIAGRGHETLQPIGDASFVFDDREVARRALDGSAPLELEVRRAPWPRAVTETVQLDDVIDEAFEVDEAAVEAEESESS